ncbi:MAG: hypothetical protein NC218_11095 [Acetobacter sp.]|nr:hypothetical protein [Acetobacter sp.]
MTNGVAIRGMTGKVCFAPVCGLPRLLPYGAPRNDGGRERRDPLTRAAEQAAREG